MPSLEERTLYCLPSQSLFIYVQRLYKIIQRQKLYPHQQHHYLSSPLQDKTPQQFLTLDLVPLLIISFCSSEVYALPGTSHVIVLEQSTNTQRQLQTAENVLNRLSRSNLVPEPTLTPLTTTMSSPFLKNQPFTFIADTHSYR